MDRVARRGSLARAPGALKSHNAEKLKGGTLWGFSTSILSQNMKKLKNFFFSFSGKKSHNAEKNWKGGPFEVFQHPFCRKTSKKCRGDPLGKKILKKKFRKKVSCSAEKNWKGDSLVSPGLVCYAEKQVKPFWFSSLDQIVHFGAIIFCRTFVELFWSVRVDRKKRITIIVAFHFMKRRLKRVESFCFLLWEWVISLCFFFVFTSTGTSPLKFIEFIFLHIHEVFCCFLYLGHIDYWWHNRHRWVGINDEFYWLALDQ